MELKLTAQPTVTRSMITAREDLRLRHLFVVHAGTDTFPMTQKISAIALPRVDEDLRLEYASLLLVGRSGFAEPAIT